MIWIPFRIFISFLLSLLLLANVRAAEFKFDIAAPPPGTTAAMHDAVAKALDVAEHSYRNGMARYKKEIEISVLKRKAREDAIRAATEAEGKIIYQEGLAKVKTAERENIDNAEISESELREYLLSIGIKKQSLINHFKVIVLESEHAFFSALYKNINPIFEDALASGKFEHAKAAVLWDLAIVNKVNTKQSPASMDEYEKEVAKKINSSSNLGRLYTAMGNFIKAARYFQISLPENPNPAQLEALCKEAVEKERKSRAEIATLREKIKKQENAEIKLQPLQQHDNEVVEKLVALPPDGISEEIKKLVDNALIDASRQYKIYLANRKIDFQIAILKEKAQDQGQQVSTKSEKDKIWDKFHADFKSLNESRNQNQQISEADFKEYLNGLLLSPEALQFNLLEIAGQKEIFARNQALAVLQSVFENTLANGKYNDAKDICAWQFDIAHEIDKKVATDPGIEYSICQEEVIPYHKNFGRLYTAMKDWPKAIYHFGISIRVSSIKGVEE